MDANQTIAFEEVSRLRGRKKPADDFLARHRGVLASRVPEERAQLGYEARCSGTPKWSVRRHSSVAKYKFSVESGSGDAAARNGRSRS
jgi:hypothetical protein